MKNTVVLRNGNPGTRHHIYGSEMFEPLMNGLSLSFGQHVHKCEEHLAAVAAAGIKFLTILAGDRKLALLLAGAVISAGISVTLLITLVDRLIW